MKKTTRVLSAVLALVMLFSLSACGSRSGRTENKGSSKYRVAMITDSADITDQSFNQTTYEACDAYSKANDVDFTYFKPDGDTDYARIAMVDVAVAEGYNVIVMAGYVFAETLVQTTFKYPDVKFIVMDMTAGDIISAAVGNAYYDNPDAYDAADYYNTENTYCAVYKEELPGYMAGYAAVKMGYRHLGYLGGMAVPAVMRFGYGYVQGINDAAKDLGVTEEVDVQYAYGGQFYGSTEITAAMDTWYSSGTEVVFACGGGIFTSAAEAAAKTGGKVIGVDNDQAATIDAYGEDMTVTSAMKSLTATVNAMLDAIIRTDTWNEHVGKIESLGLVSGDDMSVNYVGLPEKSTQWDDSFTLDDYHALVKKLYDGEITVSDSIDQMPDVAVKVTAREGTIM